MLEYLFYGPFLLSFTFFENINHIRAQSNRQEIYQVFFLLYRCNPASDSKSISHLKIFFSQQLKCHKKQSRIAISFRTLSTANKICDIVYVIILIYYSHYLELRSSKLSEKIFILEIATIHSVRNHINFW